MKIGFKLVVSEGLQVNEDVPVGYSWTVALFGPFALILRRQYVLALVLLLLQLATLGLASLVVAFFANRLWAISLLEQGWELCNSEQTVPEWRISNHY